MTRETMTRENVTARRDVVSRCTRRALLAVIASSACVGAAANSAHALELIFDPVDFNFELVDQAYGDRVTMTPQLGFEYGIAHGFTPNVEVAYGPQGAQPKLYTTGYGDLVNVLFDDLDGFGHLEVTLAADETWEVVLHGFDMAAYSAVGPINAVRVRDGAGTALHVETDVLISASTHTTFAFDPPLRARVVIIEIDSSNLGTRSDDIGIDDIVFGQEMAPVPVERTSWSGVKSRYH